MAAPPFVPRSPVDKPRDANTSPRPSPGRGGPTVRGDLAGRQPAAQLGYQGPDQGYGLLLAERLGDRLQLQQAEAADDAIQGSLGVAPPGVDVRSARPSTTSRWPSRSWGFLDPGAAGRLVARRGRCSRRPRQPPLRRASAIADGCRATLRKPHQQVVSEYPERVAELLGA
jgi:hypothetical protein